MELKKTIKYDGKLKGLHMVEGQLVDLNGEKPFDMSTTTKTEEIIDLDDEDTDFDPDMK